MPHQSPGYVHYLCSVAATEGHAFLTVIWFQTLHGCVPKWGASSTRCSIASACATIRPLHGLPVSSRLAVGQTFSVFRSLSSSLRMTLTSRGRRNGYRRAYSLAVRKAFPLHRPRTSSTCRNSHERNTGPPHEDYR
ncbi:hypothetical protein TNCV_4667341 [Trichonephila clavipes]|nr:hypothetical protein TNCV_4667341 [Trichonephila clavipes]